jgi:hypothetical protein
MQISQKLQNKKKTVIVGVVYKNLTMAKETETVFDRISRSKDRCVVNSDVGEREDSRTIDETKWEEPHGE